MKTIQRKLRSKSGSSMLLALVFLLFCLFVGGSVLAAATANAGRVRDLQQNRQQELTCRCAMQVMAGQLRATPESQLQLTIQDVKVTKADGTITRTVHYSIHGDEDRSKSAFQKLLYEFAVHQYEANRGAPGGRSFNNFTFCGIPNSEYHMEFWGEMRYMFPIEGTLQVDSAEVWETWKAECTLSENCDVRITFPGETAAVRMCLTMDAYSDTGETITTILDGVKTETTTTVIRWEDPVIRKGDGVDA